MRHRRPAQSAPPDYHFIRWHSSRRRRTGVLPSKYHLSRAAEQVALCGRWPVVSLHAWVSEHAVFADELCGQCRAVYERKQARSKSRDTD